MKNRIPLLLLCACLVSLATATMAMGAACYTPWVSTTAYNGGATVSYASVNYTANWWTQGNEPDKNNGGPGSGQPWTSNGACGGGATATATATATKTATTTATATKTATATGTATKTATATATKTATGTATKTATATATKTATATATKTATATATKTATATATATKTATATATKTATATATATSTPSGSATCAVKSAPSGKVLQGYWESWNNISVHPGMGWIPLSQVPAEYNVISAAFPVILSDGTAEWVNGMDVGVVVPTPQEVCDAKAAGHWVILSIGGAAAGIDLSSSTVAAKFVSTIVPILKQNNFDGIDIDLETGLVAGSSYSSLSTSQANLISIIDGILAAMPSNFMLTMAPETAYVTGGQIAYGGPWGAYLPIIGKYRDSGRLSWLNMQYYNGNMYGCPATSYSAGTVQGFVAQTQCMNNGFSAGGVNWSLPYSKQVPGLPAQPGAGGGYMVPSDVSSSYSQVSGIKGLMTWSINWDGSLGYSFGNNAKSLMGLP